MSKRVLYLSRDTGKEDISLSRKRPKRRVIEEGGCSCGRPGCDFDQEGKGGFAYEGDKIDSFCESGLEQAGIRVPEGACVRLEINITKVK